MERSNRLLEQAGNFGQLNIDLRSGDAPIRGAPGEDSGQKKRATTPAVLTGEKPALAPTMYASKALSLRQIAEVTGVSPGTVA
jgi:hypothetical protein